MDKKKPNDIVTDLLSCWTDPESKKAKEMSQGKNVKEAVEHLNMTYAKWTAAYGEGGPVAKLLVTVSMLMSAVQYPDMEILEGQKKD